MKRFLLPVILFAVLFLVEMQANAQRGRVYRRYPPVYRSGPMVSVGVGTVFGGFYGGPRFYGYGWGPRIGVSVIMPPPGAVVRGVPPGAAKEEINGITYYKRGDVYYRERKEGGLEPVEVPIGASLSRLPVGAKLQKIEGKYYYEKNGTLYYKEEDADGRPLYIIVGKNGQLATDDERYDQGGKGYDNNDADDYPVVKNANEDQDSPTENGGRYTIKPQAGDRFEQLPRDSRSVTVSGKKMFVSPNNIYYKEVTEDGETVYEVVEVK